MAERIFSELMGDKVEPRKAFIERHAKECASSMSERGSFKARVS